MTIIATVTFICDICGQVQAYADHTTEYSEIDISLKDMVEGWATVWIDGNHDDTVCGRCVDKHADQIEAFFGGDYRWIKRPTPGKP